MPKVEIFYDETVLGLGAIEEVLEAIPAIVARVLSVEGDPDTTLTPEDVAVYPFELGPHDRQQEDVGIYVYADFFESRQRNRNRCESEIEREVGGLLFDDQTAFAWIRLAESGGFTQFKGTRSRSSGR